MHQENLKDPFECLGGLTCVMGHLNSSCKKLASSMELSGSLGCRDACLLICILMSAATCWAVLRGRAETCWVLSAVLADLLCAVLLAELLAVLPVPAEALDGSPSEAACKELSCSLRSKAEVPDAVSELHLRVLPASLARLEIELLVTACCACCLFSFCLSFLAFLLAALVAATSSSLTG